MNDSKLIAFPSINGTKITGHFGRLKQLVVVEVANGAEIGRTVRDRTDPAAAQTDDTPHPPHSVILDLMDGCDVLVAGGMGIPMVEKVSAKGIELILTDERDIEAALALYLQGELKHDPSLAHMPDHH